MNAAPFMADPEPDRVRVRVRVRVGFFHIRYPKVGHNHITRPHRGRARMMISEGSPFPINIHLVSVARNTCAGSHRGNSNAGAIHGASQLLAPYQVSPSSFSSS